MRNTTVKLLFSLCAAALLPVSISAQQPAGGMVMPLAPPPGPYISSRPNLQEAPVAASRSGNRMPFIGNMPPPGVPPRYMPSSRQMSAPPYWWYGPMRR